MDQVTNANYIMRIIFATLIFVTVINAEYLAFSNATNYNPLQKSERLKRAPPFHQFIAPDTLKGTIKDGDNEIHLTWQRAGRYLFNKNLPVYTAHLNSWGPNHKKSDVMKIIGNVVMYHDIPHKSAIMYFENTNYIHGVVGRNYVILDLPMDRLSQPLIVGQKYVKKMPYRTHGDRGRLKTSSRRPEFYTGGHKIKPEQIASMTPKHHQDSLPELFYVETLLFVTHDVVEHMRSIYKDGFMKGVVISCLLQFNLVDMIFAILPRNDFEIFINLAGLIIEQDDGVFSEITMYPPLKYDGNNKLDINHIFTQFERYPDHFDFPFPKDSFDLIFITTGRRLQLGPSRLKGSHMVVHDIFEKRQQNNQRSYVPMGIAQSYNAFSTHCVIAHEIGKILGINENDPYHKGLVNNEILQCYGIMQSSIDHCTKCIRWSDESVRQLKVFLSENRNRCFLLNKPRSLYPSGTPIISVTPCRQCTCFGYNSYGPGSSNECSYSIQGDSCDEPLQCETTDSDSKLQVEPTILPLDGTPCGHKKVCWGEKCENLQ